MSKWTDEQLVELNQLDDQPAKPASAFKTQASLETPSPQTPPAPRKKWAEMTPEEQKALTEKRIARGTKMLEEMDDPLH